MVLIIVSQRQLEAENELRQYKQEREQIRNMRALTASERNKRKLALFNETVATVQANLLEHEQILAPRSV